MKINEARICLEKQTQKDLFFFNNMIIIIQISINKFKHFNL